MLRVLVIALVLLVAAMMLLPRPSELARAPEVATLLDAPRPLPAVDLVDARGDPFSIDELAGKPALVFFGFTHCPDVCPLTLAVLAEASRQLQAGHPELAPAVLFVSIDPARDSPERIGAYLRGFDETFIGATAGEETIAPLLSALSVAVHKETVDGGSYNVVHNGTIYVLDSSGRWAALFGGSSHRADDIVSDYLAMYHAL